MKIFFVSLGCDKNLVDSENMLGAVTRAGYTVTDDETAADVIVINTCCFINDAKEESINAILEMAKMKEEGCCKALIVTGCLATRYREEIETELPEVDAIVGASSEDKLIGVITEVLDGKKDGACDDISRTVIRDGSRMLTTGGHYAYLKIAEGCDKNCTYCVIPKVRGHFRSVPMEDLIQEAEELAEAGVKELILVAQETTLYGQDLYGRKSLHILIHQLCEISGIRWVRVLYCYPEEIYDELIDTMACEEKFCHYLDLPIQHADDTILRRMGRRTSRADLEAVIGKLRDRIPDIILRTTLISGFPGETQEQHENLCEFINEMEFDRLGVFTYSMEEGTPAARMADQVPEEIKAARRDELMELQQEIAYDLAQERIGRIETVMIEGKAADEDVYVARTYADAPNVDGYLFLKTPEVLVSGDFAKVKIVGAQTYDLIGELV